ncbi:MAG: DUF2807 domain-containing protein [Lewinella sp.]
MKRSLFLLSVLCSILIFFPGCIGKVTPYEERIVTEYYDLKDFSEIVINTPIETTIVAGEFYEVSLLTKRWEQDNYHFTKVFDNVLSVRFEADETETRFSGAQLMIRVPVLRNLTLAAAGETVVSGLASRETTAITLGDGAELKLERGWVSRLQLSAGFNSFVDGFSLETRQAEVYSVSNRELSLTVVGKLSGRLEGSGNLLYRGRPEMEVTSSGIGQVIDAN